MWVLLIACALLDLSAGWRLRASFDVRGGAASRAASLLSAPSSISPGAVARSGFTEDDLPFWEKKDLYFHCTACGRCCQNEGEVVLSTQEFVQLVELLGLPAEDVIDVYVAKIFDGWVRLKDKKQVTPLLEKATEASGGEPDHALAPQEQCVFLADDGKLCTIYSARPVQCRTYPYWPSLLRRHQDWLTEAVLPPGEQLTDARDTSTARYWSVADGGCEGINHSEAQHPVPKSTIYRNELLYRFYHSTMPGGPRADTDERLHLLSQVDMMQRVIGGTKAWVRNFVLKYNLCPFAEAVFRDNTVKYRVCLDTDRQRLIHRLKLEAIELLNYPEDAVSTALLMLPFSFPSFEDWHAFTEDMEDLVLPSIQKHLLATPAEQLQQMQGEEMELQLAFFHPAFQWANSEDIDDPLNYEKRAPFPTINLLRTAQIAAYADEAKTARIADGNRSLLEASGSEQLSAEFNFLLMRALTDNADDRVG